MATVRRGRVATATVRSQLACPEHGDYRQCGPICTSTRSGAARTTSVCSARLRRGDEVEWSEANCRPRSLLPSIADEPSRSYASGTAQRTQEAWTSVQYVASGPPATSGLPDGRPGLVEYRPKKHTADHATYRVMLYDPNALGECSIYAAEAVLPALPGSDDSATPQHSLRRPTTSRHKRPVHHLKALRTLCWTVPQWQAAGGCGWPQ